MRGHEVVARAVGGGAERRLDERVFVEILRVYLAAVDGREDAKIVVGEAHVVAIGGRARGDDSSPAALAHERCVEGLYELVLFGHAPNPAVGFNCHLSVPVEVARMKERAASIMPPAA